MRRAAGIRAVLALLAGAGALEAQRARDDGQWTMPGKDYAATRYSALAQLTPANVGGLKPVWNFSTGVLRGHEGQPLVVNNTLYVVTPYPNVLYAFDLAKPDYPLKWKYRPMVDANALGI
ncbi:MAG TPA: PQQ-dependent dehydrogenase, methanol/ethanol family, partial [Gemmatimonadales bacterium]